MKLVTLLNDQVILIGSGGHARSLLSIVSLEERKLEFFGYVSLEKSKMSFLAHVEYFRSLDEIHIKKKTTYFLNGVGVSIGLDSRHQLFESFRQAGFQPLNIISKSAHVDQETSLGDGCQIFPGAIIMVGSSIGKNAIVNTGAVVEHDVEVGDGSFIAPGAIILGGCKVGKHVLVGSGAIINPGVSIGDSAVIGSGSLVLSDVPCGSKVIGVHGKRVH
jgi:sugar O-acyltransferase (sialic acid O-acetyltransferase NeuD family)